MSSTRPWQPPLPWPSFVPKAADSAEGDGWLIGLVIDLPGERTDLVILDAMHFEDAPVAAVHLPHRVPPGFHGNWIPQTGSVA